MRVVLHIQYILPPFLFLPVVELRCNYCGSFSQQWAQLADAIIHHDLLERVHKRLSAESVVRKLHDFVILELKWVIGKDRTLKRGPVFVRREWESGHRASPVHADCDGSATWDRCEYPDLFEEKVNKGVLFSRGSRWSRGRILASSIVCDS